MFLFSSRYETKTGHVRAHCVINVLNCTKNDPFYNKQTTHLKIKVGIHFKIKVGTHFKIKVGTHFKIKVGIHFKIKVGIHFKIKVGTHFVINKRPIL